MNTIKQNAPTLLMLGIQLILYTLQNRGILTLEQTMGAMGTLATLGVAGAHRMDFPGAAKAAAVGSLVLCLALTGCTPKQRAGIPVLSTVDAVGMGLADVMGWCEDAGANATTLARAQQAYSDKDYRQAVALLTDVATSLRKNGADLPDSAFAVLKMAEGALAADAIEQGMRAISVPAHP
jgi:hypothetical protein